MRWVLIWICACQPDPTVILLTNSERECKEYASTLYVQGDLKGSWMCASVSRDVKATEVEIFTHGRPSNEGQ